MLAFLNEINNQEYMSSLPRKLILMLALTQCGLFLYAKLNHAITPSVPFGNG